jgi:hypothetical protein
MKHLKTIFLPAAIFLLFVSSAFAQSGGRFTIQQSVIAGGGGSSSGGSFRVEGTSGQPAAGTTSTGGTFSNLGGFWNGALAPTAATVDLTGRVLSADGRGIGYVRMTLTSTDGSIREAMTNPFGYYRFLGLESGQVYIVTVNSKNFVFSEPSRVIFMADAVNNFDFIALPKNVRK